MVGPLDGIRVLDLTTMVSGPIATMMLADQGAEVVKIEPPRGEYMRHAGHKHEGMSASFLSCNRSKRSLSVDIKSPKGLDIVKKLVEEHGGAIEAENLDDGGAVIRIQLPVNESAREAMMAMLPSRGDKRRERV